MDNIQEFLNVIPVPVLKDAFTILISILSLVQQAQDFKEQLQVLATCTATLLKTLDMQYRTGQLTEESTFYQLQDLHKLLEELASFVQRRSSLSFLKLLFAKDQSLMRIDGYQSRITAMVQAFKISALLNIRCWQDKNELARKADQQFLRSRLEQIGANQLLLIEALNVGKNNPMAMMATFKRRINEKQGDQEELMFFKQSLRYLSTASGRQVDIKPWTISRFDIDFGETIATGGFGIVYRGTWNQTEVALKVMKNSESIVPRPAAVLREVETWSKLRHPHVLQFLGANILDDEPFIVMPWIANGNVRDYISNNPSCDRLKLIKQVALGLVHLHSKNVIHGDLKGVNILVDDGERALLCDFGLSRIKADVSNQSIDKSEVPVGSPHWMAPELFNGQNLRFPCDVYSFAMTMYELFTNEIPLGHLTPSLLREFVVNKNGRPGRPNTTEAPQLSDEVWSIINLCWEASPTNRPTADAVCDKLKYTLSTYPSAIASNCLLDRSPQNVSVKSLPLEDEPKWYPVSPPVLTHHIQPRGVLSRFLRHGMKTFPMSQNYRDLSSLENSGNVASIVQSSDGKILIAGLSEGSCNMWYLPLVRNFPQDVERSFDPVTTIAFELSTSTYVAGFKSGHVIHHHRSLSGYPSTLTLTGNDRPIICLHVLNIVVMALSTNARKQDPAIIKWGLSLHGSTSSIVTTFPLHGIGPSSCHCAAFSLDGKEIYTGTSSGSLFVSSTDNGQLVHRPFHLSSPPEGDTLSRRGSMPPDRLGDSAVAECRSLAISPDGKKVMVSYSSGQIRLWDIKARTYSVLRPTGVIKHSDIESPAYSSLPVTFSSDGSYVAYASVSDPRTVDIQDVVSKQVSHIDLQVDGAPTDGIQSLDISPNNKRLIITFHNSNRIMLYVWD